jgi:acyl-CoA thioesterase
MEELKNVKRLVEFIRTEPEKFRELANSSPYYMLLGMELVECREGFAKFRLPHKEHLMQLAGVVHGGAIASIADSAGAMATLATAENCTSVATAEMKVNFIAPTSGENLFAEGRIVHCGSTLAVADVEVKDSHGVLVAKALATYALFSDNRPDSAGSEDRR